MLDTREARTDLTDRECAKIIGGMIGGLCQLADVESVRNAVRWWANQDEAWKFMKQGLRVRMPGPSDS